MRAFFFVGAFVACLGCLPPPPTSNVVPGDEIRCPDDLPPPSDTCLEGQCGNEIGVGRPCTKGGGECDAFDLLGGEAGICVVDFADNTNVFCCTRPCSTDDECGSGAVCATNPANDNDKGCVPRGCEGR